MAKYYCMLEEKTENVVLCFQQVLELHMFIYNCAVRESVTILVLLFDHHGHAI